MEQVNRRIRYAPWQLVASPIFPARLLGAETRPLRLISIDFDQRSDWGRRYQATAASPRSVTNPTVSSKALPNLVTRSSSSAEVMMSGGEKPMLSPMARTIRPCSWAKRATWRRSPSLGSNGVLAALSATISTPAIRPTPRTSPTSGWFLKRRSPPEGAAPPSGHGRRCRAPRRSSALQRDRGADRMAGIGEAMAEGADLVAAGRRIA